MTRRREMTVEEFNDLCLALDRISYDIIEKKRPEYTLGAANVLANFDKAADDYGVSPYIPCMMLLDKQLAAIKSDLLLGIKNSEPMESRFGDLRNFVYILWCLFMRESYPDKSTTFEEEKKPDETVDFETLVAAFTGRPDQPINTFKNYRMREVT